MSSRRSIPNAGTKLLSGRTRGILWILASMLLAGCASGPRNAPAGPTPTDSLALAGKEPLMPGDALHLSFSGEPKLNGEYPIDETGTVGLPLLGAKVVTGKPASAVKRELTQEYDELTRNQDVQVVYLRRIRVLGEVRKPGLYRVDPTMTFGDALALAGGSENDGNIKDVRLVRNGIQVAKGIDLRGAVAATVHSGDQIYVPKTSWLSRYGAVVLGATISAVGAIIAFGK